MYVHAHASSAFNLAPRLFGLNSEAKQACGHLSISPPRCLRGKTSLSSFAMVAIVRHRSSDRLVACSISFMLTEWGASLTVQFGRRKLVAGGKYATSQRDRTTRRRRRQRIWRRRKCVSVRLISFSCPCSQLWSKRIIKGITGLKEKSQFKCAFLCPGRCSLDLYVYIRRNALVKLF